MINCHLEIALAQILSHKTRTFAAICILSFGLTIYAFLDLINLNNHAINSSVKSGEATLLSTINNYFPLLILLVTTVGLYTLFSRITSQKRNDIAILKATGFTEKDLAKIFIIEALILGITGAIMGLLLQRMIVVLIHHSNNSVPFGYLSQSINKSTMIISFVLGISISILTGFFSALKASHINGLHIFKNRFA
jgi:lipoprotein-releasing system permease protein